MQNNSDRKQRSFVRSFPLPGIALLLLISIFLSGCSANNLIYGNLIICTYNPTHFTKLYQEEADLLCLVNPWNSLDKDYAPSLARYNDDLKVDKRAIDDLLSLLRDCRDAGYAPYLCSAYRSYYKQVGLFEKKVRRLMEAGMDESTARIEAARVVATPGTSEHQLGLAFDIIDSGYENLDESQADTPTQKWLMENSWRYGFILRYPEDKSHITGIIYEPWHYRYVGKEAAEDIYKSGLCFEEWLEKRENDHLSIVSDR